MAKLMFGLATKKYNLQLCPSLQWELTERLEDRRAQSGEMMIFWSENAAIDDVDAMMHLTEYLQLYLKRKFSGKSPMYCDRTLKLSNK